LKKVGAAPRTLLDTGALVRLPYPPYHVLVARVEDDYVAIEDACNHAGASLADGERQGTAEVLCPMHRFVFNLRTGELCRPQKLCDHQRTFVTKVEGEQRDVVAVYDPLSLTIRMA
jgi:nitrite reductase/ring-hydroxylating ferredoxin subunit